MRRKKGSVVMVIAAGLSLLVGGMSSMAAKPLKPLVVPSALYPNIQSAINAAPAGGIVEVSDGTYLENIVFNGSKQITVRSVNGRDVTIINGTGGDSVVTFMDDSSTLEGFTITGGTGKAPNNEGGGIHINGGAPTVKDCSVTGNTAGVTGVDMGGYGGGILAMYASPVISNCVIEGNSSLVHGGGVTFFGCYTGELSNSLISNNESGMYGGGLYFYFSSLLVSRTHIHMNRVREYGGGVHSFGSTYSPRLENCVIDGNQAGYGTPLYGLGGGVYTTWSEMEMINCTIVGNSAVVGGGIFSGMSDTGPVVTNSILWGNTAQYIPASKEIRLDGGYITVTYSDVEQEDPYNPGQPYPGEGNIMSTPLFTADDCGATLYALLAGSAGIDAGTDTGAPSEDFCGGTRPVDGDDNGTATMDMGAFEFRMELSTIIITKAVYDYQTDRLEVDAESAYTGLGSALYVEGVGSMTWVSQNTWTSAFTDIAAPPSSVKVCGALESCRTDD